MWVDIPSCPPKSPFWNLNGHVLWLVLLTQSWRMLFQNHSGLPGEIPWIHITPPSYPTCMLQSSHHEHSCPLAQVGFLRHLCLHTFLLTLILWDAFPSIFIWKSPSHFSRCSLVVTPSDPFFLMADSGAGAVYTHIHTHTQYFPVDDVLLMSSFGLIWILLGWI